MSKNPPQVYSSRSHNPIICYYNTTNKVLLFIVVAVVVGIVELFYISSSFFNLISDSQQPDGRACAATSEAETDQVGVANETRYLALKSSCASVLVNHSLRTNLL